MDEIIAKLAALGIENMPSMAELQNLLNAATEQRILAEDELKAEKTRREAAEDEAKAEKTRREAAEERSAISDGTFFLSMCDLNMTKTPNFNEMLDKPPHERPRLWDRLIKSIPETSLEYNATQQRTSVPAKIRKMKEDIFGCPSQPYFLEQQLPDEKFPAAHILAQGKECRRLLQKTIDYLCGGDPLSDFVMNRLLFGFKRTKDLQATLQYNIFQQYFNFIRYRDQFVSWDSRHASIFIVEKPWLEQLNWDKGQAYSVFFLALTPRDFARADLLTGSRVKIVDLGVAEERKKFDEALEAAAEGQMEILRRNLPPQQSPSVETSSSLRSAAATRGTGEQHEHVPSTGQEPFDGKVYRQTLQAIANQGYIHVLSSKHIPKDAKVIRVEFSGDMAPHPAFLTTKGINALVNFNCSKGLIDGLAFSPDNAAIAIPGCLSVEGPETSCGLCRFHFATHELGGCESLADYFNEESVDEDDENAGESLLRGTFKNDMPATPSPNGDSKASSHSGRSVSLRELSPNMA